MHTRALELNVANVGGWSRLLIGAIVLAYLMSAGGCLLAAAGVGAGVGYAVGREDGDSDNGPDDADDGGGN